jgi:hypothetical protein
MSTTRRRQRLFIAVLLMVSSFALPAAAADAERTPDRPNPKRSRGSKIDQPTSLVAPRGGQLFVLGGPLLEECGPSKPGTVPQVKPPLLGQARLEKPAGTSKSQARQPPLQMCAAPSLSSFGDLDK